MRPTHLSFHLDQDLYALPLTQVRELVDYLPSFRSADGFVNLRGVMDLRGAVIPLIDVREPHGLPASLLYRPEREDSERSREVVRAAFQERASKLDGIELLRRIRRPGAPRRMPVVIVSMRGSSEDQRRALAAGADAYLVKTDLSPASIWTMLARFLG